MDKARAFGARIQGFDSLPRSFMLHNILLGMIQILLLAFIVRLIRDYLIARREYQSAELEFEAAKVQAEAEKKGV